MSEISCNKCIFHISLSAPCRCCIDHGNFREKEENGKQICGYCLTLKYFLTKASPRRQYKFCPMCGKEIIK